MPKFHICGLFYAVTYMLYFISFCNIIDEEKLMFQFGERLKELRKAKGYSNYEQFAYAFNINRVQYGRYEKGNNISLKTLVKILNCHGMSLSEFFSEGFD
jgi:hypothetical protein